MGLPKKIATPPAKPSRGKRRDPAPPGNDFLSKLGYGGIDRNPAVKKRVRLD